ncbi:MAG: LysR family transcriptional regulator [Myxococcaceae bacterium]|nr:LysR family transcriptional regulator [Myxococcaceae bacterium]
MSEVKPSMERHRRVWQVWNWLPAFRAAAEFQSLQRAALAVNLSPSALSRAINLLERNLGEALFLRSPSGLTLTERGHALLVATRDAVRLVHEALPSTASPQKLRVAAAGPALPVVLADGLARALPDWSIVMHTAADDRLLERLRCGDLDLALSHTAHADHGITSRQLPSMELVLAGPASSGRHRLVVMDTAGFDDPAAELRASSWPEAERMAKATGLPVVAPWCLVGDGLPVTPLPRSVPVFAHWRAGLYAGQSAPYERVTAAVSALLAFRPAPPAPSARTGATERRARSEAPVRQRRVSRRRR